MTCNRDTQVLVGDLRKEFVLPKLTTILNVHATSWVGNNAGSGEQVALQIALACVDSEREEKV